MPAGGSDVLELRGWRWFDIAAFAAVPAGILLLLAVYLASPQFFLAYVLEPQRREALAVEQITFAAALIAGILLLGAGFRFWRLRARRGIACGSGANRAILPDRSAAMLTLLVAVACLIFAGEEIDWGQHFFGWKTPESYRHISGATNLHNAPGIPFRLAADLFLLSLFVLLPIAWRLRLRHVRAMQGLGPAVPEPAVVSSILIASLWRWLRPAYAVLAGQGSTSPSFYTDFLGQINEQREMLTAIALLIYAVYRVRLAWSIRAQTA